MSVQIVWFKRDLRIKDHEPLANACREGCVLGIYVYEPEVIQADDFDGAHLRFINESLIGLRKGFQALGGKLLLRVGNLPNVFADLETELGQQGLKITTLRAHEETGNQITFQRDRKVRDWAKQAGVEFSETPQNGVVRRLTSRDGWSSVWAKRMRKPLVTEPTRIPSPRLAADFPLGEIKTPDDFGIQQIPRRAIQVGGEQNANSVLDTFLYRRGIHYRSDMSSPILGEKGCSRLSPYLAYGNISHRTVVQSTLSRLAELREEKKKGLEIPKSWLQSLSSYQSRLSWHCHFMQKLEDQPGIEFENFNRAFDGLREDEFCDEKFAAWCCGQTGYPMVDACMRALHQTGWINFRMRAMLVSFAAYHLWLHWRKPAIYLARLFLDYEPGIHYSQVQMQSGVTGINTIRIYSPAKQAADQDPQGIFIRTYVPELQDVPDKLLTEPFKMTQMEQTFYSCKIGTDYPKPIVDHSTQYGIARDRIHAAKRDPGTIEASKKVYQRHGSRKTPMNQR